MISIPLRCWLPWFLIGCTAPLQAVIFDATGDPTFNTTAPDGALAGSGWQYQGFWGGFLGTPIAPNYFITAGHVGGSVGDQFVYQGIAYTTDGAFSDPTSDLRIWHVTAAFSSYAPLFTASNEVGLSLVVIGRGTQRGDAIAGRGWLWGADDYVTRWGTNTVSATPESGAYLSADFDHIGGTESHLSGGDSGGAVFLKDPADNVWKLAGINYAVSGPYYPSATGGTAFNAALYNQTGYFFQESPGVFVPATGPGEFYATRISSHLDFIQGVIPEPGTGALFLLGMGALSARRRRPRG